MIMTLILPWFPIILAVGVAGRLLGRPRATFLGITCALFWIALTQASLGLAMWQDGWTVMTLIAGSAAIAFMGTWSGQDDADLAPGRGERTTEDLEAPSGVQGKLSFLCDPLDRFDEWLSGHRDDADPWPAFGEFIREVLRSTAGATHVQIFRLTSDEQELIGLHAFDPLGEAQRRPARQGIPGHVLTTGRCYVHGDAAQGELVQTLAKEAGERIAWCFPVTMGVKRLGVVLAGKLSQPPDRAGDLLRATEHVINLFWRMLLETQTSRSSAQRDPVTGVYTRPAFLRVAESALEDSYRQREPVTLVVVAIEGLRDLSDSGDWESADEITAEVAKRIRSKLRTDDCVGRFDGSRFVLLLRRVDSELASLIVGQLMSRMREAVDLQGRGHSALRVRCGVAGSGTEQPELRSLVARSLLQARRAREANLEVSVDVPAPGATRNSSASPRLSDSAAAASASSGDMRPNSGAETAPGQPAQTAFIKTDR